MKTAQELLRLAKKAPDTQGRSRQSCALTWGPFREGALHLLARGYTVNGVVAFYVKEKAVEAKDRHRLYRAVRHFAKGDKS